MLRSLSYFQDGRAAIMMAGEGGTFLMQERGHLSGENTLAFATSDRCVPPKVQRLQRVFELPGESFADRGIKAQRMHQCLFADLFVADAPR
jgi:hypothetical protein